MLFVLFIFSKKLRAVWSQTSLAVIRCRNFVVQFATEKYKHEYIQKYNFVCCFVWVWNLVVHIEGGTRLRVFENRVSRRIFGPKRDEVTGERRKLHKEELNDLYCLHIIVRMIKSTIMWRAVYVAHMKRDKVHTGLNIRYHAKYTTAEADVNICQ